jgi:hypothetical protein
MKEKEKKKRKEKCKIVLSVCFHKSKEFLLYNVLPWKLEKLFIS